MWDRLERPFVEESGRELFLSGPQKRPEIARVGENRFLAVKERMEASFQDLSINSQITGPS